MKTELFVLALFVMPGPQDSELRSVGFFDSREECRTEARMIVRQLRERHPDWINVGFHCRAKQSSDRNVLPREDFLPGA